MELPGLEPVDPALLRLLDRFRDAEPRCRVHDAPDIFSASVSARETRSARWLDVARGRRLHLAREGETERPALTSREGTAPREDSAGPAEPKLASPPRGRFLRAVPRPNRSGPAPSNAPSTGAPAAPTAGAVGSAAPPARTGGRDRGLAVGSRGALDARPRSRAEGCCVRA